MTGVVPRHQRTAGTRTRILEAAMRLCMQRGPLAVPMGQIADEAGVERVTLYRHFGSERQLHRAVAAYCMQLYPPPDPGPLREIKDPVTRTSQALDELYAHWERMAPMVRPILRDADIAPDRVPMTVRDRYVEAIRSAVLRGFPSAARRRRDLAGAVRHAFDFRTWDSLDRCGFARRRAVGLMTRLVQSASLGGPDCVRIHPASRTPHAASHARSAG